MKNVATLFCNIALACLAIFNVGCTKFTSQLNADSTYCNTYKTVAMTISPDGSTIVGKYTTELQDMCGPYKRHGFTSDITKTYFLDDGEKNSSVAHSTSYDGSIVVGNFSEGQSIDVQAVYWRDSLRLEIGTFGLYSDAVGISYDSKIIAVNSAAAPLKSRACIYSDETLRSLGTLGGDFSFATAISGNGERIIGTSYDASGKRLPFLWANGVMKRLPGGSLAVPITISRDGRLIVMVDPSKAVVLRDEAVIQTYSFETVTFNAQLSGNGQVLAVMALEQAYIVDFSTSPQPVPLEAYLRNRGVPNVQDWELRTVNGISDDGMTLVGYGVHNGEEGSWIAKLSTVGQSTLKKVQAPTVRI